MTSKQKSSNERLADTTFGHVESLAGVFHPHAIEVQDFSHYGLVIDVRSEADFEEDHIPGAAQVKPCVDPVTASGDLANVLPPQIHTSLKPGASVLVYCGQGGRDSQPVAAALRSKGWAVDVLPGGWINYRRWVKAGVEVLPRLIPFRIISTALGSEGHRVLRALRAARQQVLDVEGLAGERFGSLQRVSEQPSQAFFESQLLQALRELDAGSPVWITDVGSQVRNLKMPMALQDALAIAPTAVLQATLSDRVRRWREDEPALQMANEALIRMVFKSHHADPKLLAKWTGLSQSGTFDQLVTSLLEDCFDVMHAKRCSHRNSRRLAWPPLKTGSLAPRALAASVNTWLSETSA